MTFVFTRNTIRLVDEESINAFGIPSIHLMENAAKGIRDTACAHRPNSVLIVCGAGNNGGDGYAAARLLADMHIEVKVISIEEPKMQDASINCLRANQQGIDTSVWDMATLPPCDLIIDGIFGTGLTREVTGKHKALIEAINSHQSHVISIDIPSGLDCDFGTPLGTAIQADQTVSLIGLKAGFLNEKAKQYTGEIIVIDIGCPQKLIEKYGIPQNEYDA